MAVKGQPRPYHRVMALPSVASEPAARTARVLLVDDEADLRAMLQRYLRDHGFEVQAAADAAQMRRFLQRDHFDALLLDIGLPDADGLQLCRDLRAGGEVIPILMLTARGDPVDRVVGLEMGADDYLSKPFNPRELVARIRALLRRHGRHGHNEAGVRFGPWRLDPLARRLERDGREVLLSSGECALLLALASQPGRPLGRERLIALAYGADHEATDRSVDVQIMRLRKVLEDDPGEPRYVKTVRGVGYVLAVDGGTP
jgi:two-component system, OmpR family, phosphate regulon response regulator OmpR